ncbi:hypothetical protein ES703_27491 [subsurface metagenome]
MCIRQPRVKGNHRALNAEAYAEGDEHAEQEARATGPYPRGQLGDDQRIVSCIQAEQSHQHGAGADDGHDDELQPGIEGPPPVVAYQQESYPAHDLPEDEKAEQVAAEHDAQHGGVHQQQREVVEVRFLPAPDVVEREHNAQAADQGHRDGEKPGQSVHPQDQIQPKEAGVVDALDRSPVCAGDQTDQQHRHGDGEQVAARP